MKPLARCVAALMTIGLLGCSSVGDDCVDCAAGGSGGAPTGAAGAGGQATGGAGGRPFEDGTFCGTMTRPLVSETPCMFDLGPLPSSDGRTSYETITIFADGVPIARDQNHDGGWDYVNASRMSIAVYGSLCQDIESGAIEELAVAFTCLLV